LPRCRFHDISHFSRILALSQQPGLVNYSGARLSYLGQLLSLKFAQHSSPDGFLQHFRVP
jgi:hypothetical protein